MKHVAGFLWRLPVRMIGALSRTALVLGIVFLLTLNTATLFSGWVFGMASSVIELTTGLQTVRQRHATSLDAQVRKTRAVEGQLTRAQAKTRRLATANTKLIASNKKLIDSTNRVVATSKTLRRQVRKSAAASLKLQSTLADDRVLYRGRKVLAKQAVADSSKRVARRTLNATTRNIFSMPGEALPVLGLTVIAAATAWEVHDACELMKEMHELDVAFNPSNAISQREVCGQRVPTKEELLATVKSSPHDIWTSMHTFYDSLPDVSLAGSFERLSGSVSGLFHREPPSELTK